MKFLSARLVSGVLLMATLAACGFHEDFESFPEEGGWEDGSIHGRWVSIFDGLGSNGIEIDGTKVHTQLPMASSSPDETHASLIATLPVFGNLTLNLRVKTVEQLRTPVPNPWETAWVLWHFTDDDHAYYFTLKTNGWELGKLDPNYPGGQRFLATGPEPKVTLGSWQEIRVDQSGPVIAVWVAGDPVVTFTDEETPYTEGSIGLYNEDAHVHFDDISVRAIP